jgi:hypothetical protein
MCDTKLQAFTSTLGDLQYTYVYIRQTILCIENKIKKLYNIKAMLKLSESVNTHCRLVSYILTTLYNSNSSFKDTQNILITNENTFGTMNS